MAAGALLEHGSAPPPPSGLAPRGGGGRGWVVLLRARDDIEAHLVSGCLAEAGIETRLVKDRAAPGAWLHGGHNPWAPAVVLVRRCQLDDARLVLAEADLEAPAPPAGAARRAGLVWWSVALALGVVLSLLALVQVARGPSACQLPVLCSASAVPTP